MRYFRQTLLLWAASMIGWSCSEDIEPGFNDIETQSLQLTVSTGTITRAELVTGTTFDSGKAIGVALLVQGTGASYDNQGYSNVKYTSSGTGNGQTWAASPDIKLSSTLGQLYAYYPYSSSVTDVSYIPINLKTNEVDYMWAEETANTKNVSNKKPTVTLSMRHALTAIRCALKRGSYTGTGKVTAIEIKSDALGTSATWNAKTGKFTGVSGTSTGRSKTTNFNVANGATNVDFLMIPNGQSKTVTFKVTVDGQNYIVTSPDNVAFAAGTIYSYSLILEGHGITLNPVKLTDWSVQNSGSLTPDLDI